MDDFSDIPEIQKMTASQKLKFAKLKRDNPKEFNKKVEQLLGTISRRRRNKVNAIFEEIGKELNKSGLKTKTYKENDKTIVEITGKKPYKEVLY